MATRTQEPYPLDEPRVSTGELVGRVSQDFGVLVRDHIELAKEEIREEAKQAGRGAGILGGSALAGWLAVVFLSFGLAWGLAEIFDIIWLGFLVVGVIWAIVAGIAFMAGRKEMSRVEPAPEQTIAELREDKQWLSEQTS